jgi:hypothetical protein
MILEIGVIQKRTRPLWPAPGTVAAADAFAETVALKYAASRITASGVELALAYEPPRQANYFQNGSQIDVFPVVNIHARGAVGGTVREPVKSRAALSSGYGQAQAEALFERLFSRHARVAAFASNSSPQAARPNDLIAPIIRKAGATGSPASIERVLPRAALAEATTQSPAPARRDAVRDPGWGTPFSSPAQPAPVSLPAPEIRRVADQVMRELDHRLVARRERMGAR